MSKRTFFIAANLTTMLFLALVVIVILTTNPSHDDGVLGSVEPFPTNSFVETAMSGTVTAIAKTPTSTAYDIFTVVAASATAKAQIATPTPSSIYLGN